MDHQRRLLERIINMKILTSLRRVISLPFLELYIAKTRLAACRQQIANAGIWFVDIPRTSSTTLKLELGKRFGKEFGKQYLRGSGRRVSHKVIHDHSTASEVRNILSPELWNRLFTFSIVRNPWDRCYSLFRYRIANNEIPRGFPFIEYLRLLERKNTRNVYSPFGDQPLFKPMCDFVLDENNNQLVNYIGKYEKREEFMSMLKEKIGIELSGAPKAEVLGKPADYREAYDAEGLAIIQRMWQDDIDRFGYEF
jgi:hypothetical protein